MLALATLSSFLLKDPNIVAKYDIRESDVGSQVIQGMYYEIFPLYVSFYVLSI